MKPPTNMVQVAAGHDGRRVRERAAAILARRGVEISELDPRDVRIDIARTEDGRSRWYVSVNRDVVGELPDAPEEVD